MADKKDTKARACQTIRLQRMCGGELRIVAFGRLTAARSFAAEVDGYCYRSPMGFYWVGFSLTKKGPAG